MRVTTFMIYNQFVRSLQKNLSALSESNEKLATGKRINKPSDDVIGINRSIDYKVSINLNRQYLRNIDEAMSHLSYTEMRLSLVSDTLNRINELTLTAISDNTDPLGRQSIANEVRQLRDHLLTLVNSKFRDRYVFSGYRTDIQSFNSTTYEYEGDEGYINVLIDNEAIIPINIPGIHIFGYSASTTEQITLTDGRYIRYIPNSGTTITVEIYDANNLLEDSFSFSNVIQMTDILYKALNNNDVVRIKALLKPFEKVSNSIINNQAFAGALLNRLEQQISSNEDSTLYLKTVLSNTEDVDLAQIISEISKNETALQALRQSSVKQLSQSLFDFLR